MINLKKVKSYCKEDISKIENYDKAINDNLQTWDCHHKAEILLCGRFTVNDLMKFNLYYKRLSNELIFLTKSEHISLHHKGKKQSSEAKRKIAEFFKGKPTWNKGKKGIKHSEETKRKISNSMKGKKRGPYKKKLIKN